VSFTRSTYIFVEAIVINNVCCYLVMATVSSTTSIHPKTWWSPNTYKTRFVLNYKRISIKQSECTTPTTKRKAKNLASRRTMALIVTSYLRTRTHSRQRSFDISKVLDSKTTNCGRRVCKLGGVLQEKLFQKYGESLNPECPGFLMKRDEIFFRKTRKFPEFEEVHV
jgi:hypothetical protein